MPIALRIDLRHHGAVTADPTTYVALLRGVNVGGRNIMSMPALKECCEQAGLNHVRTYSQSGNVIFDSDDRGGARLSRRLERAVARRLAGVRIVLISHAQLKAIVANAPAGWDRGTDLRRNIAFLYAGTTPKQVLKQIEAKPGVDTVEAGKAVVYMATAMSDVQKSGLRKLVGTPVYRDLTIRTYGTCRRILALMEESVTARRPDHGGPGS